MRVQSLSCRNGNLVVRRHLSRAGQVREPTEELISGARWRRQVAVGAVVGDGFAFRSYRTPVRVKRHRVLIRRPLRVERLIARCICRDFSYLVAGAVGVLEPAAEGIAGAGRSCERYRRTVGVTARVAGGVRAVVQIVGDVVSVQRVAELRRVGHISRYLARLRRPAGKGIGVAGVLLGRRIALIIRHCTVAERFVLQLGIAVHPRNRIGQAVIVDADNRRAVRLDGQLVGSLCRCEAGVGFGCRHGLLTRDAGERFELELFVIIVRHILSILLIVLDGIGCRALFPVRVERLGCGDGNLGVCRYLLAVRLRGIPAEEVIAGPLGRCQCAVSAIVGDRYLCGFRRAVIVQVQRYIVGIRRPLRVQGHGVRYLIAVKVPCLGAALVGVPAAEGVAGLFRVTRLLDFLVGLDCLACHIRAAVRYESNSVIVCRPPRGVLCALGDGFRQGRTPAVERVAAARGGRCVQVCAVLIGLHDVFRAVVEIKHYGILVTVIVDLYDRAAVRRNGLFLGGFLVEAGVFLVRNRRFALGRAFQLFRCRVDVAAAQLFLIALYRVLRVLGGPPLRVKRHALAAAAERGHSGECFRLGVVVAVLIPAVKDVTLFYGVCRPAERHAGAAGQLRNRRAAHGVKADVAFALGVAPRDVNDLLNGLGCESERRLFPCDGHVGVLFERTGGDRLDHYRVACRVIGKARVGESDIEILLVRTGLAAVLVYRAEHAGFEVHAAHIVGGRRERHSACGFERVARVSAVREGIDVLHLTRRPKRPLVRVNRRVPCQLAAVERLRDKPDVEIHTDFDHHGAGGVFRLACALLPRQMVEEVAPQLRICADVGGNADFVEL